MGRGNRSPRSKVNDGPRTPGAAAHSEEPVLALIQRIKDQAIDPALLGAEDRRRCVEVLRGEGYTIAAIAQILRKNERTIRRDIDILRAECALALDPRLPERMVGQLASEAEHSVACLRRIARDNTASAMERLMAETAAWKVFREMFEKLQSVGYLPKVPTGVVAEVYSHAAVDPVAGYGELAERLKTLAAIDQQDGEGDQARVAQIRGLLDEINRARLAVRVEDLAQEVVPIQGGTRHESI